MANLWLNCVVRKDLQLPDGLLAAQVAHISDQWMRDRILDEKEFTNDEKAWMKNPYINILSVDTYDELIYVANKVKMNVDMIRRFLRATELATQYIVNHPEESWKVFSSTSKELHDQLNEMAWSDTLPRLALRPEALDEGRYARFEKFLSNAKLVKGIRPVSKLAIDLGAQ